MTPPIKLPINRVAVVTGAARGIGRSVALRLARDGHDVVVADVRGSAVYEVEREIQALGKRSFARYTDVSKEEEVKDLVGAVARKLGSLDIMVANAGIAHFGSVLDTKLEDYQHVMANNAQGIFLCYKHAGLQMVEQGRGGRIIGASSLGGKMGNRAWFSYCASKFAVRGMTQAAALELAPYGITVNAYAPGAIDTQMVRDAAAHPYNTEVIKNANKSYLTNIPVGFMGQPDDVASYVSWLTSENSGFVTGQTMNINGGMIFD
ncbi:NAD(P)-binding protein [Peniophora sp. CONT]|nr:NAD(P)-binding protein [Peniophora sp. CONT]